MPTMPAPDQVEQIRAWSYRQQRLHRPPGDPDQALAHLVGVYSSHPTAPLSLLARLPSLTAPGFQALDQERRAVRVPAMRGSIFLVPTSFATHTTIFQLPRKDLVGHLARAGVDEAGYEDLGARILAAAPAPVTTAELQERVPFSGRLMTVVRMLAYERRILRLGGSSLRSDTLRYVATDAWLGGPIPVAERDTALTWLAGAYLAAFGPASVEDFAWWAGITRTAAKPILAGLDTVEVAPKLLLLADQAAAFAATPPLPPDTVAVLPKWDPYTMGYRGAGRQRLCDGAHLPHAYTSPANAPNKPRGDGFPLLLRQGRAIGRWSHQFSRDRLQVTLTPFPGEVIDPDAYEAAFARIGDLLGASAVAVSMGEAIGDGA